MDYELELSIVMPCLNEERTIGTCITKAFDWMKKNNVTGEVVIGDNGSIDKSILIAEQLGALQRGYRILFSTRILKKTGLRLTGTGPAAKRSAA